MEFKKFLVNKLILFFMLSTLIAATVALMGSAFDGEARLTYGDLPWTYRAYDARLAEVPGGRSGRRPEQTYACIVHHGWTDFAGYRKTRYATSTLPLT